MTWGQGELLLVSIRTQCKGEKGSGSEEWKKDWRSKNDVGGTLYTHHPV